MGMDGEAANTGAEALLARFAAEIDRQEDILYGVALFFEGLNFLYAGQEAVRMTYRKQLRNIIQTDRLAIDRARELLDQARQDHSKAPLLEAFEFHPCQGYPQPAELRRRAEALVRAYRELFPDRPRSEPLSAEDVVRLLDAAAVKLEAGGPGAGS